MFLYLYRLFCRFRARLFTALCRRSFGGIGSGSVLLPPIRLAGEELIQIGQRVFVGPNCWFQVLLAERSNSRPAIIIGDETSIVGTCTIIAVQNVTIESRVLIAGNVYVSDHTHAHGEQGKAIKDQGVAKVSPVRVCEGAWLGQNVVICPGVTIGRNAVIGANSVVRHDVPDFSVAAGVPARIIRRVDEVLP